MAIFELDGNAPHLSEGAWVAESAEVIGRVELHQNASVWPKVVVRGDNDLIQIGEGSNVQDASILHTDPGYPLIVGKQVTIGHQVMLQMVVLVMWCEQQFLQPISLRAAGVMQRVSTVLVVHGGMVCEHANPHEERERNEIGRRPQEIQPAMAEAKQHAPNSKLPANRNQPAITNENAEVIHEAHRLWVGNALDQTVLLVFPEARIHRHRANQKLDAGLPGEIAQQLLPQLGLGDGIALGHHQVRVIRRAGIAVVRHVVAAIQRHVVEVGQRAEILADPKPANDLGPNWSRKLSKGLAAASSASSQVASRNTSRQSVCPFSKATSLATPVLRISGRVMRSGLWM